MQKDSVNKILIGFIGFLLVLLFVPTIMDIGQPMTVSAATDFLEDLDYVVFTAAQYDSVAKEATAAAAVANAEAAAVSSQNTLRCRFRPGKPSTTGCNLRPGMPHYRQASDITSIKGGEPCQIETEQGQEAKGLELVGT